MEGRSLHITSHQLDAISPDQSPSKDCRDLNAVDDKGPPLPFPDPIIIHRHAFLTPDGSPPAGPPPYRPPDGEAMVTAECPSEPGRGMANPPATAN